MTKHLLHVTSCGAGVVVLIACGAPAFGAAQQVDNAPVVTPSTLSLHAGQALELGLRLPNGETWSQVNIGQFMVREPSRQRTVEPPIAEGSDTVAVELDRAGFALIVLDVGPSSEKGRPDSWQRTTFCTKLVVEIEGDSHRLVERNPGLTAKVGSKIELLPLLDPTSLRPGDELPVRLYFEGDKQVGQSVSVISPPEDRGTFVSDSVGSAKVPITRVGRWVLRYEKEVGGQRYVAEFIFDVAEQPASGVESEKGGKR